MFAHTRCTDTFPSSLEIFQGSIPDQPCPTFPRHDIDTSLLLAVLGHTITTTTTNSPDTVTTLVLRARMCSAISPSGILRAGTFATIVTRS